MFESAELGHTIDKQQYEAEVPGLRAELLDAQFDLREAAGFAVVILVNGVDAGYGSVPRGDRTGRADAAGGPER